MVVRAPIVVDVIPEIWVVERSPMLRAFSEGDDKASSCVVVRPCVWVEVKAASCAVEKLSKVEGWSPPICVAVKAPSWSAPKP